WMKDSWFRKPVVGQLRHLLPCNPSFMTPLLERAAPQVSDVVAEHVQCPGICMHGMVVEVALDDIPQPFPLRGDRLGHAPPHLPFEHLELRPHAVRPGLPFDLEFARAGFSADESKAQEVEGLRMAEASALAAFRREASELDQPGLLGV